MTEGLQALNFSKISEEAGLSRQLVRYYFADTDAVMVALCDHLAALYRDALVNGVAGLEEKHRLEFFLDFYFDLLEAPRKPRDDQAYDACFAYAAGSDSVRTNLRTQYGLLGQVLSHEIQLTYPNVSADEALELSYLFVCLMYGHWKMVATLGYAEEHRYITRRAMDRLLQSYDQKTLEPGPTARAWAIST